MDNKFIAIGIDLGTTNSCAAFINASGSVEIIPNSEGFRTTPSVFSIDENKKILVGKYPKIYCAPLEVFHLDKL